MDNWDSESDSYDPIKARLEKILPFEKQKFYEILFPMISIIYNLV
jgi:hypothetical protein